MNKASVFLAVVALWWGLAAFSDPEKSLTVPARANIFGPGMQNRLIQVAVEQGNRHQWCCCHQARIAS
jgi:hypothetical protein